MINLKNLHLNKTKIDEKSNKNTLIHYVNYVTSSSVRPLYLFINKVKWYIEKSHENKYLTLVPADKSKRYTGKTLATMG